MCRARKRVQHGVSVQQISVIDTDGASTSQGPAPVQQDAHVSIPSVSISGPDSPPLGKPLALHPSARLETVATEPGSPPTGLSEISEPIPVPQSLPSPSLESVDHTVSSISPHSAPLSLLCEVTSLAQSLPIAMEPIPVSGDQPTMPEDVPDVVMDHAEPKPVNVPRSRASSMSSGMSYDEAKDVSGRWKLTMICRNMLTYSLAQDPRIQLA